MKENCTINVRAKIGMLLAAFALVFCMPLNAFGAGAFDKGTGVTSQVGSVTNYNAGNLFAVDHSISDTAIENDLYWAGQALDANKLNVGTSGHGSILAAGQEILLKNIQVADSVRIAGQNIVLEHAQVTNNITLAGQSISIGNEVSANGVYVAGQTIMVSGTYKGGFIAGSDITFNGTVEGDLELTGANITIGKNTKVTGVLTVPQDAILEIPDTAEVAQVVYSQESVQTAQPTLFDNFIQILYSCMAHVVLAGLFFVIIRKQLVGAANMTRHNLVRMLLAGLVVFIVAPFACLLLLFPLVTIPVVVLLVIAMVVIALFSIPFVGSALGMALLEKRMNPVLAAVIGTVILTILANLPFVSFITMIFCIIFTAGYLWCSYWEIHKQRRQERFAARQQAVAAGSANAGAAGSTGVAGAPGEPVGWPPAQGPNDPQPSAPVAPEAPAQQLVPPAQQPPAPAPQPPAQPPAPTGDPVIPQDSQTQENNPK